jgi:hypothetical protein
MTNGMIAGLIVSAETNESTSGLDGNDGRECLLLSTPNGPKGSDDVQPEQVRRLTGLHVNWLYSTPE